MAEAILCSVFVKGVLEKTTSLLLMDRFKDVWGADIHRLLTRSNETMKTIQTVLEDAEEKQLESIAIRFWLSKLKDVAHDLEDLVDELQFEVLTKRVDIKTVVRNFFSSDNPLLLRIRMARRISEVVIKIDDIGADRERFCFKHINNYDIPVNSITETTDLSYVPESSSVVGRREDLKNIFVQTILSQGEINNHSLTVLPVEMGVRVSEALAEAILESAVEGRNQFHTVGLTLDSLHHSLRQMLSSKRYILVSDEDVTMWEQLKLMSSFGPRGTALIAPSDDEQDKYSVETSSFVVYSFAEIGVAMHGFSESSKIGKRGYGSVYKAELRGAIVAIKILDSHSKQSKQEFFHELDVLCQMRHQSLVNLIGACFECYALVYEFLPNGSLEDCLRNCSNILTWKIRTHIIFDICSSLKFLHSRSVVHGDIKPHNILLDASFNGKLADFGFCRFLPKGATTGAFLETCPKGTLEYIEFNFLETGILRLSSDLYSFGVTILKLVTGQQPLGLSRRVSDAYENTFEEMIDATAGSWPFELAHKLAYWGLQCCYNNEKSSQLMDAMWICLEEMLAEITELQ